MKTVLIISPSDLKKDPRVNRQIRFLNEHYHVITAGFGDPEIEGVEFIDCTKLSPHKEELFQEKTADSPPKKFSARQKIEEGIQEILSFLKKVFGEKIENTGLWKLGKKIRHLIPLLYNRRALLLRRYEEYYWDYWYIPSICLKNLSDIHSDIIIANDIYSLPIALKIANGAKVIFDAHEYAPKELEDVGYWEIFFMGAFPDNMKKYLCRKYIPKANVMITVCQGIADEYEKNFGAKPIVITNAPDYETLTPKPTNSKNIRLIYHGIAVPIRYIENIIVMMNELDERFELDLMLVPGVQEYIDKLKKMANGNKKIRFIEPVDMRDIPRFTNQYDIGVFLLEAHNFNYLHALPNKFFEFIQARLAIAIGPSPEMARIVKEYDLGVVAKDFAPKTLANCLKQLDQERIDYYKQQSHKAARVMSAEQNKEKLIKLVEQVLK